jgi:hypothetical protein
MKKLIFIALFALLALAVASRSQTTWVAPQTTLAGIATSSVVGSPLVTPPDANLHVWLISISLKVVTAAGCTAGSLSAQFVWTDPTGSNSYTAISIPFGSLAGTPASGSSLGSQSIIGPLLLFTSTTDPIVVNMTTPTCSSFSYAYALSASQLY